VRLRTQDLMGSRRAEMREGGVAVALEAVKGECGCSGGGEGDVASTGTDTVKGYILELASCKRKNLQ
jgi:hypothetical protein